MILNTKILLQEFPSGCTARQTAEVPILITAIGLVLLVTVLVDVFEAIVLPRTVMRRVRLSNVFFTTSRRLYRWMGNLPEENFRQSLLVGSAPMTLLCMIVVWSVLLILGWSLVYFGLGWPERFSESLYFSGVTFLTLGYGDIAPTSVHAF